VLILKQKKNLGIHFDQEQEIGIEITDELIPYATEYFVGVTHDTEEYTEYIQEQMEHQAKDSKKKKK